MCYIPTKPNFIHSVSLQPVGVDMKLTFLECLKTQFSAIFQCLQLFHQVSGIKGVNILIQYQGLKTKTITLFPVLF